MMFAEESDTAYDPAPEVNAEEEAADTADSGASFVKGYGHLLTPIETNPPPIAVCSYHYRYDKNSGHGALKYDPVSCSEIRSPDTCRQLWVHRQHGGGHINFQFHYLSTPWRNEYSYRKFMAVPSVGLPELLCQPDFLPHLLWFQRAKERPTLLVVHESEAKIYHQQLGDLLFENMIGLVSWTCLEGLVGFGVSRLAAQQAAIALAANMGYHYTATEEYPQNGGRSEVVLCDVNVHNSQEIADGYDTDEGEKYFKDKVKSSGWYTAAGFGTGIPWYQGNPQNLSTLALANPRPSRGGNGRPIEQVVMLNQNTQYDPCFITSSEDMDMTEWFLAQENSLRQSHFKKAEHFKYKKGSKNAHIEKIAIGNPTIPYLQSYYKVRDDYLERLAYENDMPILYKELGQEYPTTVGQLAVAIATKHNLKPVEIRSLIIEKILLQFKLEHVYTAQTE